MDLTGALQLLCDKFGLAFNSAKQLIPELVRYQTALYLSSVILGCVLLIVGLILLRMGYKAYKKDHCGGCGWICVGASLGFTGFLLTTLCGQQLFQWVYAPNIGAIKYLMDMVLR